MTLKGALAIGFGLYVILAHFTLVKKSLALSFGVVVIVSGIMIITGAFLHKKSSPRWSWWLAEGIIDILIGAFFVVKPQWAAAFFLYLLAIWASSLGILQIATSFRLKAYMERWWLLIITGLFSILFAIFYVFLNPFVQSLAVVTVVGSSAIVFGIILVYLSRILKDVFL
jgi:uncharacterized membrane protein HdeD (DUF308 family)